MRVCPACRNQFPPGAHFCPYDGQKLEDLNEGSVKHDTFIGLVLDERYRIEARLGQGGMGVVYAARHVIIDKPVAIKILRREYSSDPQQVERFMREARAASRIGHPNIVDVTDFGTVEGGQIYFVMEFLVGVTLSQELRVHGALRCKRAMQLAIQMSQALAAAHAKGIVHRDLKPENIFIVNPITAASSEEHSGHRPDMIKLLDFGIAKITFDQQGRRLTKVGSIFGTPQYMSPEQASGKDADHRGDIYALGCILYEMLTGEVPFTSDTFMGTLTKHMFEKPVPPRQLRPDLGIRTPIENVILKALEKNAEDRFQSMTEIADVLRECQAICETEPAEEPEEESSAPFPRVVLEGTDAAMAQVGGSQQTIHLLTQEKPAPERSVGEATEKVDAILATPTVPEKKTALRGSVVIIILLLSLGAPGVWLILLNTSTRRAFHPEAGPSGPSPTKIVKGALRPSLDAAIQHPGVPSARKKTDTITFRIFTDPSGASIYSNGESRGQTPLTLTVPTGEKQIFTIRKKGYLSVLHESAPSANQEISIRLISDKGDHRVVPKTGQATPYGSLKDLRDPFHQAKKKK